MINNQFELLKQSCFHSDTPLQCFPLLLSNHSSYRLSFRFPALKGYENLLNEWYKFQYVGKFKKTKQKHQLVPCTFIGKITEGPNQLFTAH